MHEDRIPDDADRRVRHARFRIGEQPDVDDAKVRGEDFSLAGDGCGLLRGPVDDGHFPVHRAGLGVERDIDVCRTRQRASAQEVLRDGVIRLLLVDEFALLVANFDGNAVAGLAAVVQF